MSKANLPSSVVSASSASVDQALGSVSGTVAVNLANGWVFSATVIGNTIFNLVSVPISGTLTEVEAIITQQTPGGYSITFESAGNPITPTYDTSVAPGSTQAGAISIYNLQTPDGGMTWYGRGAPVSLGNANTWALPQTFTQSISLPQVTAGTTTTNGVTTNNAVSDTIAAAAMGTTVGNITEGMVVFDLTSQTIAVRGSTGWDRLFRVGDQATTVGGSVFTITRNVVIYADLSSADSNIYMAFRTFVPGGTPDDAQDRIRLATDSSGLPGIFFGPGSYSPSNGIKWLSANLLQVNGVLEASATGPFQDATNAGGWSDTLVTGGTVADGMHAVDTTNDAFDYRAGGLWRTLMSAVREQDALVSQGWLAANMEPSDATIELAALASGSVYVQRIVIPTGTSFSNIILGLWAAGSGFTAGDSEVGIYNSSGTLLQGSTDMGTSTYFANGAAANGYVLDCPISAAITPVPGQVLWVAILVTATTGPRFAGKGAGLSGGYKYQTNQWKRNGIAATGQTSLPATITLSSLTNNLLGIPFVAVY